MDGTEEPVLPAGLGRAMAVAGSGDRVGARAAFAQLWAAAGPTGPALHRLAIAHAMADVCDTPAQALDWDQRALAAAAGVTAEQCAAAGMAGSVASLFPSLHLNLAEDYRRLGRIAEAAEQVATGRRRAAEAGWLDGQPDGYAEMVLGGLDRVERDLA